MFAPCYVLILFIVESSSLKVSPSPQRPCQLRCTLTSPLKYVQGRGPKFLRGADIWLGSPECIIGNAGFQPLTHRGRARLSMAFGDPSLPASKIPLWVVPFPTEDSHGRIRSWKRRPFQTLTAVAISTSIMRGGGGVHVPWWTTAYPFRKGRRRAGLLRIALDPDLEICPNGLGTGAGIQKE